MKLGRVSHVRPVAGMVVAAVAAAAVVAVTAAAVAATVVAVVVAAAEAAAVTAAEAAADNVAVAKLPEYRKVFAERSLRRALSAYSPDGFSAARQRNRAATYDIQLIPNSTFNSFALWLTNKINNPARARNLLKTFQSHQSQNKRPARQQAR